MKHIAQLTTISIIIATISNAGMVTDDLTPPPTQPPPKTSSVINEPPPEKPAVTVKETIFITNTIVDTAEQSSKEILNKMKLDVDAVTVMPEKSSETSKDKPNVRKYAFFTAVGQGDGNVKSLAIGFDLYSKIRWLEDGNWYLTPYTEIIASYWEGETGHTGNKALHEGGLSVYGRYIRQQTQKLSISPYIDAGIGLHYITENEIEGKELGRQWLAGSNLGVGMILGRSGRFDIGLRIRHLSNGGTKDINWGINHIMARLAIRL